ncbi:hypothetical protein [Streptomyces sp. NPDC127036]|uniref:hypothetical protein n=1 Tax=Streptomyces sp. NPDC127036 TaxID=3347112 RepID=UPI00365B491C
MVAHLPHTPRPRHPEDHRARLPGRRNRDRRGRLGARIRLDTRSPTRFAGADDEPGAFVPRHQVVARAHRKHAGLRLARTGLVMDSLVPTVLEQRITTGSAHYAWR